MLIADSLATFTFILNVYEFMIIWDANMPDIYICMQLNPSTMSPARPIMTIQRFINYIVVAGKVALPILWQFFDRWGSAEVTRTADWRQIAELMYPLGLHEKRAKMLIRFSGSIFIDVFGGALIAENECCCCL